MTPADHANTVREALTDASVTADEYGHQVLASDCAQAIVALDALQAQAENYQSSENALTFALARAEAAEAERDRLRFDNEALRELPSRETIRRAERLAVAARVITGDGTGEFNTRTSALLALRAALAGDNT